MIHYLLAGLAMAAAAPEAPRPAKIIAIRLPPSAVAAPEPPVPLVYADLASLLARPALEFAEPAISPTLAYRLPEAVSPAPASRKPGRRR